MMVMCPDDDIMCVKTLPGKAYIRGFDVDLSVTSVMDV